MSSYDELLSCFLETYEADELFSNYFSSIRKAFIAGYRAGGGQELEEPHVLKLIVSTNEDDYQR